MSYDIIRDALTRATPWLAEYLRHLRARNDPKALNLTNDLAEVRTALSSPHPEAREEDAPHGIIKELCGCSEALRNYVLVQGARVEEMRQNWIGATDTHIKLREEFDRQGAELRAALSRLAAPKPEGQDRTGETVVFDNNAIPYGQDMQFYTGVPAHIRFAVTRINDERYKLTAPGYGGEPYGNGAIYVKASDLPATPEPRHAEEPKHILPPTSEAKCCNGCSWSNSDNRPCAYCLRAFPPDSAYVDYYLPRVEKPEPAPTAPSEKAIDHELVAYGRFAVALWRCSEHPGGMDWVEAVAKMLREHDTALRSQLAQATNNAQFWMGENSKTTRYYETQLARNGEGMREALQEIIDLGNDDRAYMIASKALALAEPDGRKEE